MFYILYIEIPFSLSLSLSAPFTHGKRLFGVYTNYLEIKLNVTTYNLLWSVPFNNNDDH